jgi:hypothetical protein
MLSFNFLLIASRHPFRTSGIANARAMSRYELHQRVQELEEAMRLLSHPECLSRESPDF